jgi:hypothetical protein
MQKFLHSLSENITSNSVESTSLESGSVERQSRMLESSVPATNLHDSGIKVV